jgi:ribosomal protein S18 acetylase RimI-like enzyme
VSLPQGYRLRQAKAADIPALALMRTKMAAEMSLGRLEELLPGAAAYEEWASELFARGQFRGWLVATGEADVAGLSLWLKPTQPAVRTGETIVPYILGVYCEREHRRRGLVRELMGAAISWCRQEHYPSVQLHSSQEGRKLYESLGFERTAEMRLDLGPRGAP